MLHLRLLMGSLKSVPNGEAGDRTEEGRALVEQPALIASDEDH